MLQSSCRVGQQAVALGDAGETEARGRGAGGLDCSALALPKSFRSAVCRRPPAMSPQAAGTVRGRAGLWARGSAWTARRGRWWALLLEMALVLRREGLDTPDPRSWQGPGYAGGRPGLGGVTRGER